MYMPSPRFTVEYSTLATVRHNYYLASENVTVLSRYWIWRCNNSYILIQRVGSYCSKNT